MRSRVRWLLAAAVLAAGPGLAPGSGPAPRVDRPPNVVLIVIESLRADHLGCYGYPRATSPNIDKLAAEGVLFQECHSPASWTVPSMMSVMTGLMPNVHGVINVSVELPKTVPTLAEEFTRKGYYCGAVVSNTALKAGCGYARGFAKYDDYSVFMDSDVGLFSADCGGPTGEAKSLDDYDEVVLGAAVTRQAELLIGEAEHSGKPFFLFLFYFDPHYSYMPPAPYDKMFADRGYRGRIDGHDVALMRDKPPSGEDLDHLMALYDGEIAYTDAQIGKVLRRLGQVSAPAGTLIIVTADHGEAFGEHGKLAHGNSVYREELRIPMIWWWPGVLPKGHRVKGPASSLDIAKTLRQLVAFQRMRLAQGGSLWPALRGGQFLPDRQVLTEKANPMLPKPYPREMAITRGSLRLRAGFGEQPGIENVEFALFDLRSDPQERKNILKTESAAFSQLQACLWRSLAECGELRRHYRQGSSTAGSKLNPQDRRILESLGYISGKSSP